MIRIFLYVFVLCLLPACVTSKKIDPRPIGVCVIRLADKMCWFNKATNTGIPVDGLDGFFAQPQEDMTEIMDIVNQCENK